MPAEKTAAHSQIFSNLRNFNAVHVFIPFGRSSITLGHLAKETENFVYLVNSIKEG